MNMIFKLFSAGALMFLGVACTSCEKENENNKESDIPMEQVSDRKSTRLNSSHPSSSRMPSSA